MNLSEQNCLSPHHNMQVWKINYNGKFLLKYNGCKDMVTFNKSLQENIQFVMSLVNVLMVHCKNWPSIVSNLPRMLEKINISFFPQMHDLIEKLKHLSTVLKHFSAVLNNKCYQMSPWQSEHECDSCVIHQ